MKDTGPCKGCRDDFYNGRQNISGNECWLLKKAKLVTRWKVGWWTDPCSSGAFLEVKTYDCHREPGQYGFYEKLPPHAVKPRRLERGADAG